MGLMSIIMFLLIGDTLKMPLGYWVCLGIYVLFMIIRFLVKLTE